MPNISLFRKAVVAYVAGDPIMTDPEFDRLEDELIASGIDAIAIREDIVNKHNARHPMTTLLKQPKDYVVRFLNKYNCVVQPKYDGVAAEVVYYEDGSFSVHGRSGTDFTGPATYAVSKTEKPHDSDVVYGELVIPTSVDLPEKYKNRRNAVAGILNSIAPLEEDMRMLRFVPYAKDDNGDLVPVGASLFIDETVGPEDLPVFNDILNNSIDVETDGIVIKANSHKARKLLGFDGTYGWQFCYKFQDTAYPATITRIDWQVSPNGKVTPVANFTPVEDKLGTISRATVASAQKLEDLGLSLGGRVYVKRANKVIPYIESAETNGAPIEPPKEIDGRKTYRKGAHLFVDTRMYDNPFATIKHQVALLGAKNIVASKVEKSIQAGATDIFSFYEYLVSIGDTHNLAKLKTIFKKRTPGEWLMFLNIPGIGYGKIKLIDKEYSSLYMLGATYKTRAGEGPEYSESKKVFSPALENSLLANYDLIIRFAQDMQHFVSFHENKQLHYLMEKEKAFDDGSIS